MLLNWEKIDKSNLKGKLLKEYLSYKSANPECIIFFQVGSFYETYFQDAKHLSDITGITLTSKSLKEVGNIAMAGFPEQSLNLYIKQMLNKNFKICICQQFYDEEKDEFIRKITRTYTKGTVTENEFLEGAENNFIMAINLITNGCEISYADVSTGQFYKTNGNLDEIILEIEKLEPNEILISKENTEIFKNLIDKYNTTILEHSFFANKKTENILLNYCELTQKSYITKLENIIEYKTNSFLTMDEVTRRNLELTRTRRFLKKKGSLFWFLNYTKTPMGTRLLKKYLDEPLLDIEKIKERQSAVKEILKDEKQIENLEAILVQFCDLSRICAHISNSTIKPKDLYQISKNAKGLKELSLLCEKFKSNLLKINKKPLAKVLNFTKMLEEAIKEDPTIGDETISIVFFKDEGLLKSQQMFTDLNKHAVKTSNSLSTLYDSRDSLAVATKKVIENVPFLKKYTDKEKDNLGKNSLNLFTLTCIYKANTKILHNDCSDEDTKFLISFWNGVADNIPEWTELQKKQLTKKDLREHYITTLAITMYAFGRLGRYFYNNRSVDMNDYLHRLQDIDWLRSNQENWLGRAIKNDGKIKNNEEAVILTCAKIKQLIGVPLSKEEKTKEQQLIEMNHK